MVALLILQDEPHDQRHDRVSTGLSHELILGECVLFGGGVPLHRLKQPVDRAACRPMGLWLCNWKPLETFCERGVRPKCLRHGASPIEG